MAHSLAETDKKRILAQFYWEHSKKPIAHICKLSGISNANTIRGWAHQLGWKLQSETHFRDRSGKIIKLSDLDKPKTNSKPNWKLQKSLDDWNRAHQATLVQSTQEINEL